MVPVLMLVVFENGEVSSEKVAVAPLGLARVGDSWSHKASTPSNKNMVGDDGPFRHGPNEPPHPSSYSELEKRVQTGAHALFGEFLCRIAPQIFSLPSCATVTGKKTHTTQHTSPES